MQSTQTPTLIPLSFGANGTKNAIPEASQIGITPGAASLNDGFPPLTMTPIAAGGTPPSGADMNGILFLATSSIRWQHAGGHYAWNSAFATDTNVGGYPAGAMLLRSDLTGFWLNTADNNATNPDATDGSAANWVPGYNYGIYAVTGLTNANVTLTPSQAAKNRITLAGTLTGNVQIIFPTWTKGWEVINNTTGIFTVTCKTAAGTGVTVAQGGALSRIVGDGTNITQPREQMNVAAATTSTNPVQMGQVQTQAGTAFTTAGTAPNFTLTPSPAITAYAVGQRFRVNFNAAGTTGQNTLNISGLGAVVLAQYGPDGVLNPAVITNNLLADVEYNGTFMVILDPVSTGYSAPPALSASVASNALTCSIATTALAFRSGTLNSGAVTPLSIGNLSLTVPSGATLGTVSGTQALLAVLVAYNSGSPVLCVANVAGGLDLSETNLISPTTISGSSNSASTIYSASAVLANSPYRVVGYINITEATAGTWATAPTLVQGQGGEAFAAQQSFGFGQTEQDLTASRAIGTTYYNTTPKPILVNVGLVSTSTNQSALIIVNGVTFVGSSFSTSGASIAVTVTVRPGASYQVPTGGYTLNSWREIR